MKLSITYKVIAGDTFESVSRKQYGTEKGASRISKANPGALEPLKGGTVLNIPAAPNSPKDMPQVDGTGGEGEVSILIEGKRFRFWDKVRVTRAIDSMDTVEFGAPFDSREEAFREVFRPFSFKGMSIRVGGEPLFTGTMVTVNPVIENTQRVIEVGGYSLPGVLNDCTPSASSYPLEFDNQSLREIATSLAEPFGIDVEFQADPGAVFERVAIEPSKRVLTFLIELAKQRNLIISSSPLGKLVFLQSSLGGGTITRLQQGSAPVLSVIPFFSPQEYYSHITGIEPVILGLEGSQFTVKNPRLTGVSRPLTFIVPDTLNSDLVSAVGAKTGRMFGNMVSYSVRVSTWRNPSGVLWSPNTTVQLQAPDAMIYSEYKFIIRSVEFNKDRSTETATLNLVIPGSFRGELPEGLPWDG